MVRVDALVGMLSLASLPNKEVEERTTVNRPALSRYGKKGRIADF
jgi:hypothetical protein